MAEVTVARAVPKNTSLFAGVGSKLVPAIIIPEPTGPLVGVKEEMVGTWANKLHVVIVKYPASIIIIFLMLFVI